MSSDSIDMQQAAKIASAAAEWIHASFGVTTLVTSLTQDDAGHVMEIRIGPQFRSLMERATQVTNQAESI